MALRRGLLLHQLLLALISASILVAAGPVDHATPPFPDDGASMADSFGAPPPCAADSGVPPLLAASSVHATPPCLAEDDTTASASIVVFHGARPLGLPRDVLLSPGVTTGAPAPAPNNPDGPSRHLFLDILVAAGLVDHATPPFPDDGASPADDSSCAPSLLLATSAADSTVVFHGARCLGLQSSGVTAGAAAPAPNHPDGPRRHLFLDILAVILFVILVCFIAAIIVAAVVGIGFLVYLYGGGRVAASFVADKYARARARWTAARNKASERVHPAAQQQDAGGP